VSQPDPYTPSHAFIGESATLANFPGQQLDVELNNIASLRRSTRCSPKPPLSDDVAFAVQAKS
jgi:hypothetical protein